MPSISLKQIRGQGKTEKHSHCNSSYLGTLGLEEMARRLASTLG